MTDFIPQSCKVTECDRDSYSLGFCRMHYKRQRKHGSPDVVQKTGPRRDGFLCTCGGHTDVKDSRPTAHGIRRRRQCQICETRITTYEMRENIITINQYQLMDRIVRTIDELVQLRDLLGAEHE